MQKQKILALIGEKRKKSRENVRYKFYATYFISLLSRRIGFGSWRNVQRVRKESDCQIFWRWMSVTQFVQFIYIVAFLVLLPRLNKRENIHWFQSYKWCEDNNWNKTILNAVKIREMIINKLHKGALLLLKWVKLF